MITPDAVDPLVPEDELDSSVEAVASRLPPRQRNDSGVQVTDFLRKSVTLFVRRQLQAVTGLQKNWDIVRELAPATSVCVDSHTLKPFVRYLLSCWRTAVLELLTRLDADWEVLVEHFGIRPDASLRALSPPLGDLHRNGRSVYALSFSGGRSLVYKPRPVETEVAFGQVVAWLRTRGCEPDLANCRTLARNEYGWANFVHTKFCQTESETLNYHRRQGAFLALFWRLCGSDAISENVVVSGEHPVWIDTECLFRPDLPRTSYNTTGYSAWMRESMLTTGMVLSAPGLGSNPREWSGLSVCCTPSRESSFCGTGRLKELYRLAVVRGFSETYEWLMMHDQEFSTQTALLMQSQGLRPRILLRPTYLYTTLVTLLALTPVQHRRRICHEIRQILLTGRGHGGCHFSEGIVDAEIQALLRNDIPYWVAASTSSRDIVESGGCIVRAFAYATSLEYITRRGATMSHADLNQQAWLLSSSLEVLGQKSAAAS